MKSVSRWSHGETDLQVPAKGRRGQVGGEPRRQSDGASGACDITDRQTEGDIDRKVKVGDVPNSAVKLQAGKYYFKFQKFPTR